MFEFNRSVEKFKWYYLDEHMEKNSSILYYNINLWFVCLNCEDRDLK